MVNKTKNLETFGITSFEDPQIMQYSLCVPLFPCPVLWNKCTSGYCWKHTLFIIYWCIENRCGSCLFFTNILLSLWDVGIFLLWGFHFASVKFRRRLMAVELCLSIFLTQKTQVEHWNKDNAKVAPPSFDRQPQLLSGWNVHTALA